MAKSCRIAVDLLGAELAADELMLGAIDALSTHPHCELTFICDSRAIDRELLSTYSIIHCDECVDEQESLHALLREKAESSMHVGYHLLLDQKIDGFVSVGSTRALMALGRHLLHTPVGIDRPAVIKEFDGRENPFWLLDLGANIVQKAETLCQFAQLGVAYATAVHGVERPRVALLNIGIEEGKGPALLQEAASELGKMVQFEFVGYVEPNRMFDGIADVVVTDGYAGNIALKSVEGTVNFIRDLFLQEMAENDEGDYAQMIRKKARKRFRRLMHKLDSQQHNGASFVGLNGVVVKSHNSTTKSGMTAAIDQAVREVSMSVPSKITHYFEAKE